MYIKKFISLFKRLTFTEFLERVKQNKIFQCSIQCMYKVFIATYFEKKFKQNENALKHKA